MDVLYACTVVVDDADYLQCLFRSVTRREFCYNNVRSWEGALFDQLHKLARGSSLRWTQRHNGVAAIATGKSGFHRFIIAAKPTTWSAVTSPPTE